MTGLAVLASPTSALLTDSSPIAIDGNADLIEQASTRGWAGDGSAGDPYIVADLNIDGEARDSGISINNTDLHLVIERCVINGPIRGLNISGSSNIAIVNNTCSDSVLAILLEDSSHIVVLNNTCNSFFGIVLSGSDSNTISNNTCNSKEYGILLASSSNDNIVSNNTCSGGRYGMILDESDDNAVSNNTCNSSYYGICLYDSSARVDGNQLTNCSILLEAYYDDPLDVQRYVDSMAITSSNTINGLPVYFLKNTDLDNASVPSSGLGEIILLNVTNAEVSGLTMHDGGVIIGMSSNIEVEENTIANATDGVIVFSSDHCTIANNTLADSTWEGIYLDSSSYIVVSNNTCNGNEFGILVARSSYVIASNNTCNGNEFGILVDASNLAIVSNNSCDDNDIGIYLDRANDNKIAGNQVTDSARYGIYLETSNDNLVISNWIVGSTSYGINATDSNSNLIYGNTLIGNNGATMIYSSDRVQAYDNGTNAWNSTEHGNSWNDWRSSDRYVIDGGSMADELPIPFEDNIKPRVSITYPAVGAWYNTSSMNVTWTASDLESGIANFSVSMDGGAWVDVTTDYYEFDLLADGQHTVSVRVYDNAGNYQVASRAFNVDTVLPVLNVSDPDNGAFVNSRNVQVVWDGSSYSPIGRYWISVDGGQFIDVGTDSSYLVTNLADGQHIVNLKAIDYAGNWNTTSVSFTVDTVAPTLVIDSPANNSRISSSSVTVQWTAGDDIQVAHFLIRVDGGEWQYLGIGNVSMVLEGLAEGEHIVDVEVIDVARNVDRRSVSFVVDTVAPSATISPSGSDVAISAVITVEFSEAMNTSSVAISIDGVTGTISWNGNTALFTPSSELAYGTPYTVTVTGKDLAGNDMAEAHSSFTTLKDESTITGVVEDKNGQPLGNATVTLSNGMTTTTDASGYFELHGVPSGSYTLNVTRDGFQTLTITVSAVPGQTRSLETMSMVANAASDGGNGWMVGIVGVVVVAMLAMGFIVYRYKKK